MSERTLGLYSDNAPANQLCDLQQFILNASIECRNSSLYLNSKYQNLVASHTAVKHQTKEID